MSLPAETHSIVEKALGLLLEHGAETLICAILLLIVTAITRVVPRWIGPFGGKYSAKFTLERVAHTEKIVSRQFFNRVWGRSTVTWEVAGVTSTRRYRFRGKIDKSVLLARYTCDSSNLLDCGVFILSLTDHPDIRSGMYAGLSSTTLGKFVIDPHYTWEKIHS